MSRLTAARSRRLERRGVVEVLAERVGHGGVLGEDLQVELVRATSSRLPPPWVGCGARSCATGHCRRRSSVVHLADDGVVAAQTWDSFRGSVGGSGTAGRWSSRGTGPSRRPRPRRSRSRGRRTRSGRARRRRRSRRRRWRRTTGTRRGGGCRRPATRSGPRSPAAGCAAPGRRRSARAARRRRPGGTPRRGPSRTAPMIESVSACGCVVHRGQHRHPRTGHPQGGPAQQVLELRRRGHVPSLRPFLESVKNGAVADRLPTPGERHPVGDRQ